MNLHTLTELGCYLSAGNLDHYDGRNHVRLGAVTSGGDLVMSAEGEAYADKLVTGSFLAALGTDAPTVVVAKAKHAAAKAATKHAKTQPPELGTVLTASLQVPEADTEV